jgi:hypothetical protein
MTSGGLYTVHMQPPPFKWTEKKFSGTGFKGDGSAAYAQVGIAHAFSVFVSVLS